MTKLRGERLRADELRHLAGGRLTFLLTRVAMKLVLEAYPLAEAGKRLSPLEVEGVQHLETALDGGGGVVLLTAHFGFPPLIRPVLAARGIEVVGVGGRGPGVDQAIGVDVWDRARALRRLQAQLARRRACVFLADGGPGIEVPIFAAQVRIGLGAFALAQQAKCPVLPFFAVRRRDTATFRIEFSPPVALPEEPGSDLSGAAREFGRLLESYARRFPDHLFAYQALFDRSREEP